MLANTGSVQGQNKAFKLDSLRDKFIQDSTWIFRPKHVFPLLASDQRNSYIKGEPVNIWGIKGGVTLYDRHNVGIGAYSIDHASSHISSKTDQTVNKTTKLQYLTAFYEYSFIQKRWWEVGIPIEVGFGNYNITSAYATTDIPRPARKGMLIPLGTALDVYFKPVKWFAINVMGGYRWVIADNAKLNLNGWFYSFGGAIYVRQILQDLRYANKKRIYKNELEIINRLTD